MPKLTALLCSVLVLHLLTPGSASAGSSTATATISATISNAPAATRQGLSSAAVELLAPLPASTNAAVPAVTLVSLSRDAQSARRGSATSVVFDRFDGQDNQTAPEAGVMYAPYRSEAPNAANWHIANVIANGSTTLLRFTVAGNLGGVPFARALKVYCGGFYAPGATTPIPGTQSSGWETAETFTVRLNQAFVGTVPLSYKLDGVGAGNGTYTGQVTITLITGAPQTPAALTTSCGTQPQSTFATFFHTEGRHIIADAGRERLVFRGVNLTGLEYGARFDNPYPGVEGTNFFLPRAEDLDSIKALGLNVVRLPFEWARLTPGWGPGNALPASLNATYLSYLEGVVQQAAARQLYVILDMHDFLKYWPGRSQEVCVNDSRPHQQLLAHTWKLIASRFRNEHAVLGYDLMNEPARKEAGESCGSCDWHAIAQTVVDAIREVDGNHLLIVEGRNYSLASHWPAENGPAPFLADRVNPPRIVYSPHVFFDSGNDSQYDVSGAERLGPIGAWQHYVRDRVLPVIDWSSRNDVPVLLGETGVPCTAAWAGVLDEAYRVYLDPLGLSVIAWHFIDPRRCPLAQCPLNVTACTDMHQARVLQRYPGGAYASFGTLVPSPRESVIYGDARQNPWDAGAGYWGAVGLASCVSSPVLEGTCSMSVQYQNNFDGVKFVHHSGFDSRRFAFLQFGLYLTGSAQQDFKLFTTAPRSSCSTGADAVYPRAYETQPTLSKYLSGPKSGQWYDIRVPLSDIVDPANPVINGIAFQNMGLAQQTLYLDRVTLVPAEPTLSAVSAASFLADAPLAPDSIAAGFGQSFALTTAAAPANPPLPTVLADRSVKVQDICGTERGAPLWFVSPGQVNFLVPGGTRAGRASVTVAGQSRTAAIGAVEVDTVAPALFSMNADGKGVPAAISICVKADGSQSWQYVFPAGCTPGSCVPSPIDLGLCTGVFLQLYGTGIRGRGALANVTATIGGVNAPVSYAGAVEGLSGLDQVNVLVPRSLAGRGEVDLLLTVDGQPANPVRVNVI